MKLRITIALLIALAACRDTPREPAASATSASPTTAATSSPTTTATARPAAQPSAPEAQQAAGIRYLVRYTGGAAAEATLPMVVAIHGLGDRPERFHLLRGFPGQLRVVVPRALEPHGPGYSWFPIRSADPDQERLAKAMTATTDQLAGMIEALVKRYPTEGKPIVTGFSQGGMLSFAIAATHPDLIAAAFPVAGLLPAPMWPEADPSAAGDTPPIVALHGDADPLLPIEGARKTVAALREAGFGATLNEYPGVPHRIRPNMRRDLFRQLHEATTEP